MTETRALSAQTRKNWQVNAVLFLSALLAALSGVYFLYLPVGGFQGGRNPTYGLTILFSRSTWDLLHTWSGVAMTAIASFHLVVHWSWVAGMTRRIFKEISGQCGCMNWRGRSNVILNGILGLSFLLTALSGAYFLFFPVGSHGVADPQLLFSRLTWDLIHTWGGVSMILAAGGHFVIHWAWVVKVTRRYFQNLAGRPKAKAVQPAYSAQP